MENNNLIISCKINESSIHTIEKKQLHAGLLQRGKEKMKYTEP